jgi:hypothetical protein
MPDYQNGKIYKIWSPQGNEIYIGSTVNSLAKRLGHHKSVRDCRSRYLFENYDDVRIELIEEYPCDNKIQLNKKEGEHIRENTCLNRCIAGRTPKECKKVWRENNKEYNNEYYENNKERLSQKFDCECGGKYIRANKSNHIKTKLHIDFTQQQKDLELPE